MDVLRPELIWKSDGRCYRKRGGFRHVGNTTESSAQNLRGGWAEQRLDEEDAPAAACRVTDGRAEDERVLIDRSGARVESTGAITKISIPVAPEYVGSVYGRGGDIANQLSRQTRCKLDFPPRNFAGDVVITGPSKNDVVRCATRVLDLVAKSRRRKRPNHFLSLPLTSSAIQESFDQFREGVLEDCGKSRNVVESLFTPAVRLHLTVGCFVLMSDFEAKQTQRILEECLEKVIRARISPDQQLQLVLSGLDYMNDDPSTVDVLYAKIADARLIKRGDTAAEREGKG